jgi:hypothetical protein
MQGKCHMAVHRRTSTLSLFLCLVTEKGEIIEMCTVIPRGDSVQAVMMAED